MLSYISSNGYFTSQNKCFLSLIFYFRFAFVLNHQILCKLFIIEDCLIISLEHINYNILFEKNTTTIS